ncbi:WecB/TagA/CpsF family glycosyltransferase [Clostridiisalibacter paucivorans]|uniref:WecB/TagA/CpsF family glycosyltransferase n=1 Tax=Clostridiisalibacter paucivorans TaxID=408753 RepID=UPI00047B163C|nr:WecB/TagA/CpsF family glycosyltransferase [Clostridiisalibacter paucivorans]
MNEFIKIMGIKIDKITMEGALNRVEEFLNGEATKTIYTPNTEIIMNAQKDNKFKQVLNEGDLVVPDGIGLIYASRIKKHPLPERVTGFDISMGIINIAHTRRLKLFLLGGEEGVADIAAKKIKDNYDNILISGTNNGYFKGVHTGYESHKEEMDIIDKINDGDTDILFVGLGAEKQEKWIHKNKDKLKCKIIIGNGGTIDVLAGKVKRAPDIYQRLGLEWLYRLVKEPKRLKRQTVLPLFMLKILFSSKDIVE